MASYAISDIHGCLKSFKALLDKIGLTEQDHLYILGDLIDRGQNSKGVIDEVMALNEKGFSIAVTRGNHEWMFQQAIDETIPYVWDWQRYENWVKNGGGATMASFRYKRIDDLKSLDPKYPKFIGDMLSYVETDKLLLVHAGFNFKTEEPFKDELSMYWIRNWYETIDPVKLNGKIVIHGHAPRDFKTLEEDIREMRFPAINIDCGCVYDPRTGAGRLCALNCDTLVPVFQENIDK